MCDADRFRDRMGGFERGDDTLMPRQRLERRQRLVVGATDIGRAPAVHQMGMFRPDRGVIEPGRDRPAVRYLAIGVLQDQCFRAVKDSRRAALQRGPMFAAIEPFARRLDPN